MSGDVADSYAERLSPPRLHPQGVAEAAASKQSRRGQPRGVCESTVSAAPSCVEPAFRGRPRLPCAFERRRSGNPSRQAARACGISSAVRQAHGSPAATALRLRYSAPTNSRLSRPFAPHRNPARSPAGARLPASRRGGSEKQVLLNQEGKAWHQKRSQTRTPQGVAPHPRGPPKSRSKPKPPHT